ncbi:MAG: metal ABC transporter permease, partial [Candidatus Sumerlaeia bacterium]|nr:metal ABC transporter permease [Candidatus Sumerlaeia bacterium]
TLPGVVLAFMLAASLGGGTRSVGLLLIGAALTGTVGMLCVTWIGRFSRLREDTALAIVLSTFFGAGIMLLSMAQQMPGVSAAGLNTFIYGRVASILMADAILITVVGSISVVCCALLFKEFRLLCFDSGFALGTGYPILRLDILLMSLVVLVTVIGLQAVGLILVVSLLVIPPAAARFWTDDLAATALIAGCIGVVSTVVGSLLSASFDRLPGGAMIVLAAAVLFGFSFFLGIRRGVLLEGISLWRHKRRTVVQNLLRDAWEWEETTGKAIFSQDDLVPYRTFHSSRMARVIRRAIGRGLVASRGQGGYTLTARGRVEAARIVRAHRLWELYLITHAEIAPSHVDRDADAIEHVLDPLLLERLERKLVGREKGGDVSSPHELHGMDSGGGDPS